MTEQDIWNLATAGDGTLDPVLAERSGMPLEKFMEEKERRKAQAAEERKRLEELNRNRSTGSLQEADEREEFSDPTLSARQHLTDMEQAYHSAPEEPLEGQETLPGFEEPTAGSGPAAEPAPAALDADTVKKNISRVSFKVDYLKSPEDALIAYDAPAWKITEYLARNFKFLVDEVARETGGDPEQIADKDKRTPEQDHLLTEVAGRMQLARINAFLNSKYMDAAAVLEPLRGIFKDPTRKEQYTAEELLTDFDPQAITVKDEAALYFFAIHDDIKPTEQGKLTPEQAQELTDIFGKLDAFYAEQQETGGPITYTDMPRIFALFIEAQNPAEAPAIIEAINVAQIDSLLYPLDKPNSTIWDGFNIVPSNGQLSFAVDTSKRGSDKEALVYIGLDFNDLPEGITKNLDAFDKRIMMAADALRRAGNMFFTDTQLYKNMGNRGNPGQSDLQKINDRLTKMGTGRIIIDNSNEIEQNKSYPEFRYDGNILSFERVQKIINGKLCESAIHLFREPVLMTFARQRKQVTTVTLELLESPISKTEENLAIEDYLLERIGHMKSSKGNAQRKILYKTLCSRCHITKPKQIQRAPNKICRYLDHFKKCKWIKDYETETDGVKIIL